MIIDSSVLVAIFLDETDKDYFIRKIMEASCKMISIVSVTETALVLQRKKKRQYFKDILEFLKVAEIRIMNFDTVQLPHYQYGFEHYSRSILTWGDCFVYALAKTHESPLLFKGNDFTKTDLRRAL